MPPAHGLTRFAPVCRIEKKASLSGQGESIALWVLLLLPFAGLLWLPFYNFRSPEMFGFPFFYWYQLAWVPVTSLLIWIVWRGSRR